LIYITGDTHRDFYRIAMHCHMHKTTKDDLMIILGDNGVNLLSRDSDTMLKEQLEKLPITLMLIRGNHDRRPDESECERKYIKGDGYSGIFLVEPEYPSLLFTVDGNAYQILGKNAVVIGGAYSVDKDWRIQNGQPWFEDEQLGYEERKEIYESLMWAKQHDISIELFLAHTCPYRYIPREMFLGYVDQTSVDDRMEEFLDSIWTLFGKESKWYCGHWHTDKMIDNVRFMYNDITCLNDIYDGA